MPYRIDTNPQPNEGNAPETSQTVAGIEDVEEVLLQKGVSIDGAEALVKRIPLEADRWAEAVFEHTYSGPMYVYVEETR